VCSSGLAPLGNVDILGRLRARFQIPVRPRLPAVQGVPRAHVVRHETPGRDGPLPRTVQVRPVHVVHPRQPAPGARVEPEQRRHRERDRGTVRHDDQGGVVVQVGGVLGHGLGHAPRDLRLRLGTRARRLGAEAPGRVLLGPALPQLRARQPLPGAEPALAQALVRDDRRPAEGVGVRGRRLDGAPQVGRHDARRAVRRRERRAALRRLPPTHLVERDVDLPLQPQRRVVGGAGVPQQDDGAGRHRSSPARRIAPSPPPSPYSAAAAAPSPPRASSGSSTAGQSFHSRSSA